MQSTLTVGKAETIIRGQKRDDLIKTLLSAGLELSPSNQKQLQELPRDEFNKAILNGLAKLGIVVLISEED